MEQANTIKKDADYYIQTSRTYKTIEAKLNETCALIDEYFKRKAEKENDNHR